jgi:hypothetical protein
LQYLQLLLCEFCVKNSNSRLDEYHLAQSYAHGMARLRWHSSHYRRSRRFALAVQIFHPAGEVEAVLNKSNEYILAGAVCIAVGLLGILMSVAMWKMFGSSSGAHLASAAGRGHQVAIPVQALTYVTVTSAVTASSTASTPSDDVAGSYSPPITSPLQDGRTVPSSSLV